MFKNRYASNSDTYNSEYLDMDTIQIRNYQTDTICRYLIGPDSNSDMKFLNQFRLSYCNICFEIIPFKLPPTDYNRTKRYVLLSYKIVYFFKLSKRIGSLIFLLPKFLS